MYTLPKFTTFLKKYLLIFLKFLNFTTPPAAHLRSDGRLWRRRAVESLLRAHHDHLDVGLADLGRGFPLVAAGAVAVVAALLGGAVQHEVDGVGLRRELVLGAEQRAEVAQRCPVSGVGGLCTNLG